MLNYLHVKNFDPLSGKTIDTLVERLKQEPDNESLIHEIRTLDLLARKAYFTTDWQINTGATLLVFGLISLFILIRIERSLRNKFEVPFEKIKSKNEIFVTSNLMLSFSVLLVLVALIASFLSKNYINRFSNLLALNQTENLETNVSSDVEVVEVNLKSDSISDTVESAISDEVILPEVSESLEKTNPETSSNVVSPQEVSNASAFRGNWGDGVFKISDLPVFWNVSTDENILWKNGNLLPGYNAPVVWNNRVFATGANNSQRVLYCLDLTSGKILWQMIADKIPGTPQKLPEVTDDTGLAAPSCATNGVVVAAIFGTGDIIACDLSGRRLWAKNIGVPDNHYGHSSSLIIDDNLLFVQYDTNKGSAVYAFEVSTGNQVWKNERSGKISWASPTIINFEGRKQLLLVTTPDVTAYDPVSGKKLWSVDCLSGEVGPSAGYSNGKIFVANEYATFAAIDISTAKVVWENDEYLPEVASPVAANGIVIIATSYGVLAAYDANSGDKLWETEYNEGFYASPVIVNDYIFAADLEGVVHILKLAKNKSVVADIEMGEKIVTTPQFVNSKILIRTVDNLYCISK